MKIHTKKIADMRVRSHDVMSHPATQGVVCDAFACLAKATQEIRLQVGTLGKIRLNICDKCQSKFISQTMLIEKPQYSGSVVSPRNQSIANQVLLSKGVL